MRLGFDVDGVFANFNDEYMRLCIEVDGRDLFEPKPFVITTWNYPETVGYSPETLREVWRRITESDIFWRRLDPYDNERSYRTLARLDALAELGHDIYFITSRPGANAKKQTERWLTAFGITHPTVLISSGKGLCVLALQLDAYIDDYVHNCQDVQAKFPACRMFVYNRSWNQTDEVIGERVDSAWEMLTRLDLT